MNLQVIRSVFSPTTTMGKFYIDGEFFAYTLEDTDRQLNGDCSKKIKCKTAISEGSFKVILSYSDHFQKVLPQICDVPCFGGVRIHGGNSNEDTEGCILIGENSNMLDRIWDCHCKVDDLIQKLKLVTENEEIELHVLKLTAILA